MEAIVHRSGDHFDERQQVGLCVPKELEFLWVIVFRLGGLLDGAVV